MKKIVLLAIISFQYIFATLSLAEPPPLPGDLNRLWAHEDTILSKLDLTDEQKKRIGILRNSLTEEMAPLRSLRYEKFTELKLLLSDPTHNKENVLLKMKEFHNLIWQIVEKEMNYRLTFKDILTKKQYSKYLDFFNSEGF